MRACWSQGQSHSAGGEWPCVALVYCTPVLSLLVPRAVTQRRG
jgi:hypothetical protein